MAAFKYGAVGLLALLLAGLAGSSYYFLSWELLKDSKVKEKATVLRLTDAFVATYSGIRSSTLSEGAPVPATFRAHAIAFFNQHAPDADPLKVAMVGVPNRAIKIEPLDAEMAQKIQEFVDTNQREPALTVTHDANGTVLRTLYPSIAKKESCVNCHNAIQTDGPQWRSGDIMGAFVVDAPVGLAIAGLQKNSAIAGLVVFLLVLSAGVYVLRDIGQRRQAEAVLRKAKQSADEARHQSEIAERAKSEFLANMSHEIRTPLNGVLGMGELLAKTNLDPMQKTFADTILKSGRALLTIINDILDFSKIDAGKLELEPAPFRLREAIEDVATLISSGAAEKDLELAVRVAPQLPDTYFGDVGRLRQIVTNLVGNAVKFTEAGYIFVDVEGELLDDGTAKLTFRIEDTGIGIPEEKLERIFDKFSQVDGSATRVHEGTGLGLAIVSSLVELMGGDIAVKSEVGRGTTFTFELVFPVHSGTSLTENIPANIDGARLLIVDDNEVNRSILSELLGAWGFESVVAPNGPQALQILRDAADNGLTIDGAILDYRMPGMSGGEVAVTMKADPRLSAIPVIMLTSVDQPEEKQSFASLGVEGHLVKPARSALLLDTIIGVLRKSVTREDQDPSNAGTEAEASGTGQAAGISEQASNDIPQAEDYGVDVLVAEDNTVNQTVFTHILQSAGYSHHIANDGVEALKLYERHRPRVILMDVSMPNLNGLEATTEIRAREAGTNRHTTIIGVTAHAIKGDMERCLEAGMDDFLTKPISPDALAARVENWMPGKRPAKRA